MIPIYRIMKKIQYLKGVSILFCLSALLFSCGDGENSDLTVDKNLIDSTSSNQLVIGNVVFCIPSPVQTAILVKKVGASYDKDLMNLPSNHNSYSTDFQKALNLGVYGADLGYSTIYEQPQDGINYLTTVRNLADDIGVASAFSPDIMKRITENIGNQDSLLTMVGSAYRSLNQFLQENDRADVCALVLTGGWIESTYYVTSISGTMDSQELVDRLGEQKSTLENLIKLIEPYYNDPQFTELLDLLYDLSKEFDKVKIEYSYEKPTVDEEAKKTYINSTSKITITEDMIQAIRKKVDELRTEIIG